MTHLARLNIGAYKKGRRIDTTGKLRASIKYKQTKTGVDFFMEDYGKHVDAGVVGKKRRILKNWNKSVFNRGKGYNAKMPPVDKIKKWINDKPIRPRDLVTGRFVQKTDKKLNQMAFLMSRKIYLYGKQPTLFFSTPFTEEFAKLPDDVLNAFSDEIDKTLE